MVPKLLIDALVEAKRVAALTGAGISAESGIPTFRGQGGLWEGYSVEKVATPEGFEKDPAMVWRFYDERRVNISKAKPNRAHEVLALMENFYDMWVITQNIDGLHSRAGSNNVIELHGNIWRVKCTECGISYYNYEVPLREIPPRCKRCSGLLRPDVVWFGEPVYDMDKAYSIAESCDVMFVIGTSAQVYPAAYIPRVAWSHGAKVVEINPEETPVSSYADFIFREPATKAMDEIYKELLKVFQEE